MASVCVGVHAAEMSATIAVITFSTQGLEPYKELIIRRLVAGPNHMNIAHRIRIIFDGLSQRNLHVHPAMSANSSVVPW